ncbi:uncharacterized protein LOC8070725 [Sorghum bicolor]|uniref:uncharacterized protein LOC8070725 n=1 Tax=Sorghum bicolor TaxID=4558 RepID=UPI000B4258FB|nr:uncharacterized protein LOC8070725 [Sorghum bicolor]|eukprot:XP_021304943.1 uncharacterized protein LOC8070725 [Sorghum bicolor]
MDFALACVVKAIVVLMVAMVIIGAARAAMVHRTIQSDDGDVIDCVDMYHQPALIKRAPPEKNTEILQAKPRTSMKAMAAAASASKPPGRHHHQTWRKHGRCPAGSVRILRNSSRAAVVPEVAEMARRASPFGRPAAIGGGNASFHLLTSMDTSNGKVEVAAAYATNGPYLGARADVPYWKVDVHPDEFSMNYLLIGNTLEDNYHGGRPPSTLTNQIAVGLVTDGGAKVNCFNLDCGGFRVKENSPFALAAAWSNFDSQVGGERHAVTVSIHREPEGEKWWVSVMDQAIGYYPESEFNTVFTEAVYVEMGGRVLDTRPGGKHTSTPMGSGMLAGCGGARFAATIMEYLGIASDGTLFNDPATSTVTTTPSCYGATPLVTSKTRPGHYVAYGGPGGIYCDQADDI